MDVKIPTHVRFTKSNSRGLPGPPILGQTIDRCIKIGVHFAVARVGEFVRDNASLGEIRKFEHNLKLRVRAS